MRWRVIALFCAFGLKSCDQLRALRIIVVNTSGQTVQRVTLAAGDYSATIGSIAEGAESEIIPIVEDSRIIKLQFEYAGKVIVVADCGCIGSHGETRGIRILPGATRVAIDFGSAARSVVVDCEQNTSVRN